jgi:hypothetical protein
VLRWFPREGKKILVMKVRSKWEDALRLDEIALVLVCFDHVARVIVNANNGIM